MWHASDLQTLHKGCCRWMKLVLHVMKNLGWWFRVQPPSEMIAQFNTTSSGNSKFGIGSIPWNNLSSTEYHAPWLQGLKAFPMLALVQLCKGLSSSCQFLQPGAGMILSRPSCHIWHLFTDFAQRFSWNEPVRIGKVWNKNRYLIDDQLLIYIVYIDLNYLAQNHSTLLQILWLVHLQSVSHIFWSDEMSTLSVRFAIFANGKQTNFQFAKQLSHWWFHLCKKPEASQVRNKA